MDEIGLRAIISPRLKLDRFLVIGLFKAQDTLAMLSVRTRCETDTYTSVKSWQSNVILDKPLPLFAV